MADLVAQVAEQGPVGLSELDPTALANTRFEFEYLENPDGTSAGSTIVTRTIYSPTYDPTVDEPGERRVFTSSYDYNLAGNGKSHIIGTAGSVKVVRVKDGPVVGVHMIGARVGELIGEAQLAVNWEAYPEDIAPFIHAHPTQNEAMGEAFLAIAGKPLHAI